MFTFRQYLSVILICIFLPVSMLFAQQKEFEQYVVQNQYPEMRKSNLDSAGLSSPEFVHSTEDSVKKLKHNIVPVIMFGLTGFFVGSAIGSRIDSPASMPGECSDIFTVGNVTGGVIGTIIGLSVGYHLGEEEITDE